MLLIATAIGMPVMAEKEKEPDVDEGRRLP
jgi:hypothetical protein